MRFRLLFWILLLGSSPAFAQINQPATPRLDSVALAAPAANADTLAAIHRLFAAKRKRNLLVFAGTVGIAVVGGVVLGTAPSGWDGLGQGVLGLFLIIPVSIPALTVEAVVALKYSKKSEQKALKNFQTHKGLRHLKRNLKPKYFQEPSLPVKARG